MEDALHENGLFGMWLPAELGGSELTPRQSLEVLENSLTAMPRPAGVVMAASLSVGTAGAYLGAAAVETVFPKGRKRINLIAGQGTRAGKAVTTDGGYLVSGSWSFGSGLKHSAYIHTAAIIQETGEFRIFNPPIEKGDPDRQLGCDGPARDRQHRLYSGECFRTRRLFASRADREPPSVAAASIAWASSICRHLSFGLGWGMGRRHAGRTRRPDERQDGARGPERRQ